MEVSRHAIVLGDSDKTGRNELGINDDRLADLNLLLCYWIVDHGAQRGHDLTTLM